MSRTRYVRKQEEVGQHQVYQVQEQEEDEHQVYQEQEEDEQHQVYQKAGGA